MNKKSIKLIIIVAICVIVGLLLVIFANKKADERTKKEIEALNAQALANSTDKVYELLDGSLLFEVVNNNDFGINYEVDVNIYDEEDALTGELKVFVNNIEGHTTAYGKLDLADEKYVRYEYEKKALAIRERIDLYTTKVKLQEKSVENEQIKVSFINNAQHAISKINYGVIFYDKNNNIIGYRENIGYNIVIDGTIDGYLDNYILDKYGKEAKYDHYDVVINYACYDEY